jgi:hypothetical protein
MTSFCLGKINDRRFHAVAARMPAGFPTTGAHEANYIFCSGHPETAKEKPPRLRYPVAARKGM